MNDVYYNSKHKVSKKRLEHTIYKIVFPHEANQEEINIKEIKEKYERRIKRFLDVVKNDSIEKVFIRSDKKYNIIKNDKLINSLDKICKNYKLITVDYSKYKCDDVYTWQREYIPWNDIFNLSF
jgi:hypothetical protein